METRDLIRFKNKTRVKVYFATVEQLFKVTLGFPSNGTYLVSPTLAQGTGASDSNSLLTKLQLSLARKMIPIIFAALLSGIPLLGDPFFALAGLLDTNEPYGYCTANSRPRFNGVST